jgi:hypothetical protein
MTTSTTHNMTDLIPDRLRRLEHVHNNRITLVKRRAARLTRRGPFPERNTN